MKTLYEFLVKSKLGKEKEYPFPIGEKIDIKDKNIYEYLKNILHENDFIHEQWDDKKYSIYVFDNI